MAASPERVPLASNMQDPGQDDSMRHVNLQPGEQSYRGYQNVSPGQASPARSAPGLKQSMDFEDPRDWEDLKEKDVVLKQRIRVLRLILRVGTLLLAAYMTTIMIITLRKFLSTRHVIINGRNAWAKGTKIWPTILLLCTSSITLIVNLLIAIAYFISIRAANKTHDAFNFLTIGIFFAHMGLWIATAVFYRTGKTGKDLWGWSCSEKAQDIQPQFADVVDFKKYCDLQTGSWATSLAEVVLTILAVGVYALGWRRLHRRRIMKHYGVMHHEESIWTRFVPSFKGSAWKSPFSR